jgi:hypothetical protein
MSKFNKAGYTAESLAVIQHINSTMSIQDIAEKCLNVTLPHISRCCICKAKPILALIDSEKYKNTLFIKCSTPDCVFHGNLATVEKWIQLHG